MELTSAIGFAVAAFVVSQYFLRKPRYPDLPTLRVSTQPGSLGEYEDRQTFIFNVVALLDIGWQKYSKHGLNYLLNAPMGKYVVVAPEHLEEVMKAPESHVGAVPAQNIMTQTRHTFSNAIALDGWHMLVPVRKNLVQHTAPALPVLVEEGKLCMNEYIGVAGKTRIVIPAYKLSFDTVVRTANRVLFGVELARNPKWQEVSIDYSIVMFHGADVIRNYPEIMKPFVLKWKTKVSSSQNIARECLIPVIKERLEQQDRLKSQGQTTERESEKPVDAIQWVLDESPPGKVDLDDIVLRMLHITVAAVHTTTFTFVDILHCMAALPEFLDELREEAIEVLRAEGGWTKQALTQLKKLDSFCNEAALKLARLVLQDWQMKDGTKLPKGTLIFFNHLPVVLDDEYVEDPHKFDPWRSYRMRQGENEGHKHQFVMASKTNLTWGYGKHACPGRFFAANEIKVLLVLFMLRYDFRATNLPGGLADVMKGRWYNVTRAPIDHAELEFVDRHAKLPDDIRQYVW